MLGSHVALQCDVSRHSGLGSGKNILKGPEDPMHNLENFSPFSPTSLVWCHWPLQASCEGRNELCGRSGFTPSHPEWESEFLQGPQGLHVH